MNKEASYRHILRSSSIIGGASIINILVGLLRAKVLAVLLGPAGVGLVGLLQNLMATAATVSAMGLGNAGTRQIAEAVGRGDEIVVAAARRALFWGTLVLAVIGAVVFWLLKDMLAENVLANANFSSKVGWLALGVALTVAAGSQSALLNGLRRIGDIARVSVASALLSAALGMAALYLWGENGLLAFVLSTPLASFLLGHWYVSRLPKISIPVTPVPQLLMQWKALVNIGAGFMVAGLAVIVGQLAVRTMVQRELGADALGHFQAAWVISMTYIGFVLQAMGTDYYPRLTATIHDHEVTNRLVNEQTEVALLLAAPVFLAMLGLAPWVIKLLYSSQFGEAVSVLRWQILGDILKVSSWPLVYIVLAAGKSRTFMLFESLSILVFVGVTWFALPLAGIDATGIAFVGMYIFYLPTVFWLARRQTGFAWRRRVYLHGILTVVLALVVFMVASWSKWHSAVLGLGAAVVLGVYGLARLGHMANLGGVLGCLSGISRQLMERMGVWHE